MNRDLGTLRLETETIRAQMDPAFAALGCTRVRMSGVRLWTLREWRRWWGMLLASAVSVAISRGLVFAAGARRADSAFGRFQDGTNSPTLQAALPLGPHLLTGDGVLGLARRPSVSGRIAARGMNARSG